jgi:hypothetical protein
MVALLVGVFVALVLLTGCTPRPGGRCTNVGETVRIEGKGLYQCRTDPPNKTPRWEKV